MRSFPARLTILAAPSAITLTLPTDTRLSAKNAAAGLGALGLLLWKLKLVLFFVLTKAKLLLMGFTQMSTLFSMLLSLGIYWSIWG
jgi:hypothetical protein